MRKQPLNHPTSNASDSIVCGLPSRLSAFSRAANKRPAFLGERRRWAVSNKLFNSASGRIAIFSDPRLWTITVSRFDVIRSHTLVKSRRARVQEPMESLLSHQDGSHMGVRGNMVNVVNALQVFIRLPQLVKRQQRRVF